jgi:phosphoserine phosphatase
MSKEGVLTGKVVQRIVDTAAKVHEDQEVLEAIRKAGASCIEWGG